MAGEAQAGTPPAGADLAANPLLSAGPFPLFDQIRAEHVVPGMKALLEEASATLDEIEAAATADPAWETLADPLERLMDRLGRAWGSVTHLKAVQDTKELREAVEAVQPDQVAFSLRVAQSEALYKGWKAIRESEGWGAMSEAQQRFVEGEMRDSELAGIALEGDARQRMMELSQELSKLSTKFSNNVLDGTKAYEKLVTAKAEVDGLPESALELAAQTAAAKGHDGATAADGPWMFTLDYPSYLPVMTHAKNRELREEVYRASITKASAGDLDNTPLIDEILTLRAEKAAMLGFANYGEVSMARKMATVDKANALLDDLRDKSYAAGVQDHEDVIAFAKAQGCDYELKHWDVTFWAERMKEDKYSISDEILRPYFALPNVLDGLFALIEKLFGVQVEAADGEAPVWHKDVRFFKILENGEPKAYFYLDPYSRPAEKRGGAWMDEVIGRSKALAPAGAAVRLPCAHMVCNQTPPVGAKPSLMTFREVETLFHEMGHALQHMLTEQEVGHVAGIRGVEWDAVELPSQFMENWCYHKTTLMGFAKHYETGEPLPDDLYAKLVAARTYRAGTMMLRQLHFSSLDINLHTEFAPGQGETVHDRDQAMASKTSVLPPLPENRFLCGFSHIFAGGYSAGYYSYKWAEVLSADAFEAFEEAGLDDEAAVQAVGKRFKDTVLGLGGGRAPELVFRDFRGRDPSTAALLRHSGLLEPAAA